MVAAIPVARHLQNLILLLLFAGYVLFNHGFMLLSVEVGGLRVPLGEGLLLVFLFALNIPAVARLLKESGLIYPLAGWWGLGGVYIVLGFWEAGGAGLRNASHVIDSLFLLMGLQFSLAAGSWDRFYRWLTPVLAGVGILMISYQFRDTIASHSPAVSDRYGQAVPLFATYMSDQFYTTLAAVWLVLIATRARRQPARWLPLVGAAIFTGAALVLFQARLTMLQIAAVCGVLLLFNRAALSRWMAVVLVVAAAVPVMDAVDLPVHGRYFRGVQTEYFFGSALTIVGMNPADAPEGGAAEVPASESAAEIASDSVVEKAVTAKAAGWSWRLDLWKQSWQSWTRGPVPLLFGNGFGEPLVMKEATLKDGRKVVVTEPHNAYLSILGKLGLAGLVFWGWAIAMLLRTWWRGYTQAWREERLLDAHRLLLLLTFTVMIAIHALVQDTTAKPFYMMPYYFWWGAAVGAILAAREGHAEADRNKATPSGVA